MPDEYFKDTIRPQLLSLLEEDALKDTTITLRASIITKSSFILSLLSPVLRTMICGNFRESFSKEISLDDVDMERLLKLLQLACGKYGLLVQGVEELLGLGELAERLQMTAVRVEVEAKLFKELRAENCLEMVQRSEAIGLELLQKKCCKRLRDEFGVISQMEGFLKLSEETMGALLEGDELGINQEEDVFEAVARWISNSDEGIRGEGLLRKMRYGVMSSEYLAGLMSSASLPGNGMVKLLVGEAMAKNGVANGEEMWDGVERLCDKWMVARRMGCRIIGADVLKDPGYVAMDGQGRVVVSDSELHEIIVFNRDGSIVRRFGSEGAAPGQFISPRGVAVDRQGHIVVADYGNDRIQVLNADGSVARCIGSEGTAVGQLEGPCGVAIDREGHIVVADHGNRRIQVFDADGSVVRHLGSRDAAVKHFIWPKGVAVDGVGRIVVVDWWGHKVQVFNGDGSVALCIGHEGNKAGQLSDPIGVAVDSAGRFIVADSSNDRVQVFNSDGSVARVMKSAEDGVGELSRPCGVCIDRAGRFIVTECGKNNRVQVL